MQIPASTLDRVADNISSVLVIFLLLVLSKWLHAEHPEGSPRTISLSYIVVFKDDNVDADVAASERTV